MATERAEMLERIRKIRERAARDPRSAEGRTAANLARSLMERHGITAAELRPPVPARTMPARPPRPPRPALPIRVDLDLGGFRIRWSGKL